MPACHEDGTVCASLPVTIRSISLVTCTVHQSTHLHYSVVRDKGQEPEVLDTCLVDFGPFDSWFEISQAAEEALRHVLDL